MKKILWFSRHEMAEDQKNALVEKLGNVEITQVSGTAPNVHVPFETENGKSIPLKELVQGFDIVAVVLPIGMLQQLLPFCEGKPVIMAVNERIPTKDGKFNFHFLKWERILKVSIDKEDF